MFDKMIKDFKDISELQTFSEAQHKTIIELSKKNQQFVNEIEHLKKLLEGTTPLIKEDNNTERLLVSDEEAIAKMQLERLRNIAFDRELTLEEAKRFEIFFKVLNSVKNNPKIFNISTKKLSNDELIKLLEEPNEQK